MFDPAPVSGTSKIWHQKSMTDGPVSGRNRGLKLASVSSLLGLHISRRRRRYWRSVVYNFTVGREMIEFTVPLGTVA